MPEALETINHFQWTENISGNFHSPISTPAKSRLLGRVRLTGILEQECTISSNNLYSRDFPDLWKADIISGLYPYLICRCYDVMNPWTSDFYLFIPFILILEYGQRNWLLLKRECMGNKETWMGNAHGEKGSEKKWGKKPKEWLMRLLKELWFKLGPIYRFPVPIFSFRFPFSPRFSNIYKPVHS